MPDELRLVAAPLTSLVVALGATPFAISIACRMRFYDSPFGYKAHGAPTPYLGGAAVVAAFLPGALIFGSAHDRYLPIIVGALVLWFVGTIDDRRPVPPGPRLLASAAVAVYLSVFDLGWSVTPYPVIDAALTVLWVIAVVNAFNLMDNIDGAASAVGAVSLIGIGGALAYLGSVALAAVALALAGACIGFLRYNLASPSRIFLGDGGTMAIGFVAAAGTMALSIPPDRSWTVLVPAALLVGLPLFDSALVVVSRYRRRAAIWSGGRDHTTHRLLTRLRTARAVAIALAAAQAAVAGVALGALELNAAETIVTAAVFAAVGAIVLRILETPEWQPPWMAQETMQRSS